MNEAVDELAKRNKWNLIKLTELNHPQPLLLKEGSWCADPAWYFCEVPLLGRRGQGRSNPGTFSLSLNLQTACVRDGSGIPRTLSGIQRTARPAGARPKQSYSDHAHFDCAQ